MTARTARPRLVTFAVLVTLAALAACTPRPPTAAPGASATPAATAETRAALLAAEDALFAAIARRDAAALESLVAPEFVLRMPGQPDVPRAAFLAAIAGLPGEILAVRGDELDARALGPDLGVVSGVQVVELRMDGKQLVDRSAFADVFRRGPDGRWRMVFAYSVSLTPPAAP